MARHLRSVTNAEWQELHHLLHDWLVKHRIAGSVAQDYSLYTALDDCRIAATLAPQNIAHNRPLMDDA